MLITAGIDLTVDKRMQTVMVSETLVIAMMTMTALMIP
jgi:hypothetical protein